MFSLNVPALRERNTGIFFAKVLLEQANRQHNFVNPAYLQPEVVKVLEVHQWPGNVRELQNLVDNLVVITGGGRICVDDLPRIPPWKSSRISN